MTMKVEWRGSSDTGGTTLGDVVNGDPEGIVAFASGELVLAIALGANARRLLDEVLKTNEREHQEKAEEIGPLWDGPNLIGRFEDYPVTRIVSLKRCHPECREHEAWHMDKTIDESMSGLSGPMFKNTTSILHSIPDGGSYESDPNWVAVFSGEKRSESLRSIIESL